jgi:5-formyltetrahydrofolate cyclo-ligase
MSDRQRLRKQLRQARRELAPRWRARATATTLSHVRSHHRYLRSRRIALYAGADGELCPMGLVADALARKKTVYLPVLHPFRRGRLMFCAWRPGTPLRRNRFGIREPVPDAANLIPLRHLDLVLVPLLGFDDHGNRLGMGGGYYDRSFAFRKRFARWRQPFLLGIGFELQRVHRLEQRSWDVTLDAVVTETGYRSTSGRIRKPPQATRDTT